MSAAVITMDVSFWVGVLAVVALFGVYLSEIWTKHYPDARITMTISLVLVCSIVAFLLARTNVGGHEHERMQHVVHHHAGHHDRHHHE